MKKILLLAYTNFNFGDDMFIYTICKAFPNQEFVLYANQTYRKTFGKVSNLTIAEIGTIQRFYNKLINKFPNLYKVNITTLGYAAVVYVIGGLFDEDESWKSNVNQYGMKKLKNIMWRNSYGVKTPFFLLGCNMTRVMSTEYIGQMEYLFRGLKDICFRDKYSYSFFEQLSNTRYAPDIVFNYDCKQTAKEDSVVISVWGPLTCVDRFPQWKWAEELWDPYEKFIIEIIGEFQKMGKKVTLLALCKNEGDLEACNKIRNRGKLDVDIVNYNGNLDETVKMFETASFVVGTRFHSVVMALNAGCAFYPIVYESKTEQLLIDIGYDAGYSHIEKQQTYNVENVMRNYRKKISFSCENIKKMALEQFRELKNYLEV